MALLGELDGEVLVFVGVVVLLEDALVVLGGLGGVVGAGVVGFEGVEVVVEEFELVGRRQVVEEVAVALVLPEEGLLLEDPVLEDPVLPLLLVELLLGDVLVLGEVLEVLDLVDGDVVVDGEVEVADVGGAGGLGGGFGEDLVEEGLGRLGVGRVPLVFDDANRVARGLGLFEWRPVVGWVGRRAGAVRLKSLQEILSSSRGDQGPTNKAVLSGMGLVEVFEGCVPVMLASRWGWFGLGARRCRGGFSRLSLCRTCPGLSANKTSLSALLRSVFEVWVFS